MWIFSVYGFFSVACATGKNGKDKNKLMIRARSEKHLENLKRRFPVLKGCRIVFLKGHDYPCRIFVRKSVWKKVIDEMMEEQDWSNFKDAAAAHNGHDAYVSALHQVWSVMFSNENAMRGIKPPVREDGFGDKSEYDFLDGIPLNPRKWWME